MLNSSYFRQMIGQVFASIKGNKVRTFLTCLGIIIGIAAVIGMMSMSRINMDSITDQMNAYGYNYADAFLSAKGFTEEDYEYFESINSNVLGACGTIETEDTTVFYNSRSRKNVKCMSFGEDFYQYSLGLKLLKGRLLNGMDNRSGAYVCLVNNNLAGYLFQGEEPVGQEIICHGLTFTIVGVIKDKQRDKEWGGSKNYIVHIPQGIASKISGIKYSTAAMIFLDDPIYGEGIQDEVMAYLMEHFPEEQDPYVYDPKNDMKSYFDSMEKSKRQTLIVVMISLLVGGIGIMNMMLVSVTERTREIGLRKALGATPGVIQQQFLMEAICLSLLGGIIGIAVGLGITVGMCIFMKHALFFPTTSVLVGLAFSTAVGVIFGWLPARSASLLNPIDALRSE